MKYLLALRSKASFFPALPYAFQHWKFLSRSWQSVLCYASQMWCRPKSLSTLRHAIPWLSTEPFNFGGLGVWCEAMTAVRRSQQIRAKQNHSCILSSDCPRVILSVLEPCCLWWGKECFGKWIQFGVMVLHSSGGVKPREEAKGMGSVYVL